MENQQQFATQPVPQQPMFIATPTFQGFAPESNPYYSASSMYAPPIPPQPTYDIKPCAREISIDTHPNRARWFSVLLAVALSLNALMVFVWLVSGHGFPWFIYVMSGSWLLVGSCYIIRFSQENKLFRLHLLLAVDLDITVFLTYLFAFTGHPWFIYVFCPTIGLLLAHHFLLSSGGKNEAADSTKVETIEVDQTKWQRWRDPLFRIHLWAFFVPLNVMLFICWSASSPSTPWFIYPLLTTAMGPIVHYLLAYEGGDLNDATDDEKRADLKKRLFLVHLALCSGVNFMLFLIWYSSGGSSFGKVDAGADFPWFVFPAVAWYGIVVLHSLYAFSIKKRQLVEMGKDQYHSAMHVAGSFQSWASASPGVNRGHPGSTPYYYNSSSPIGPVTTATSKDASAVAVGREEEEVERQAKKAGGEEEGAFV